MAIQPQSVLCRRLTEAYVKAMFAGQDTVNIHVNVIADILDYLDSTNTTQTKIHKPFLDDSTDQIIETFIKLKEKENGPIF